MKIEGEKMNRTLKIIFTIIVILALIFTISPYSEAFSLDEVISNGDSFLSASTGSMPVDEGNMMTLSKSISGILLTIAIIVTLISAAVMAIKFVFQSVEDKAKIKESMIPWVIGIFISFGAYAIWKLTMSIFYQF